ncbi:MAG: hypothetical protein NVS4B3_10820 [Gemmatimonadaceae bacterium]
MNLTGFAAALSDVGIDCSLEVVEGVVVIRDTEATPLGLAESARRHAIVTLAARHGFTHVALELTDDVVGARLSRG